VILIYVILKSVVIVSNEIIENGTIKITDMNKHTTKTYPIIHSDFKNIKINKPGKYKVNIETNTEKYSKILSI